MYRNAVKYNNSIDEKNSVGAVYYAIYGVLFPIIAAGTPIVVAMLANTNYDALVPLIILGIILNVVPLILLYRRINVTILNPILIMVGFVIVAAIEFFLWFFLVVKN
jgi:hypothetical protein